MLGGPKCRTRSELRHLERDGLPGPSRTWNGGEWGHEKLSPLEKAKCHQDDVMRLRMVMLFVVAEEVRKASQKQVPVAFLLEHPAAPMDVLQAVSWWRTEQWQALRKVYGLSEVDLDQGEWGGHAVKPTTLGTNVEIKMTFKGAQGDRRTKVAKRWLLTNEELVQGSKRLARWAPRLMMAIADGIMSKIGLTPTPRLSSCRTHIQRDHYPFRKDCQVCRGQRSTPLPSEGPTTCRGVELGHHRTLSTGTGLGARDLR